MKNKTLMQVGALAAAVAGSSIAQAEVSANIAVTSNYLWRGVTQSDDTAAVQGGVDYEHDSGFFAGAWLSSIDFGSTDTVSVYDAMGNEIGTVETDVDDGAYELDLYLGYGGSVGDFGYSVAYIYYAYPELDYDSDFSEIAADISWNILSAGFAYTVDSEVDDGLFTEGDVYYWGSAGFALEDDWSLAFTVGYYDFDADGDAGIGDASYMHYQADLSKSAGDLGDFTLTLSEAEEESGDDDTKVIVSWAKSF